MKAAYLSLPLALLMTAGAAGAAPVAEAVLPAGSTRLDIVAEGSVTRVPDVAQVTAGVVTQAPTAAAAMAENATRMTAAINALRKAGIEPRDIQTASVDLSPQYRYGENQPPILTGYQASNSVSVRLRSIARAGATLDALVAAGVNRIDGPTLMVDKPEDALDEARVKAVQEAKRRADLYAKASGMTVVRILGIDESEAAQPPRPMPMMAMARMKEADSTPVEAGEQKLAVRLSVSFELR